ncbi:MAG: type II toxin-antitoxin system VapC family toxin [Gemmatales bacterium]
MSFLLDTDTCSFHLKRPAGLMHRFVQHAGTLHLSSVVLAELDTWAFRRPNPVPLLHTITHDLLPEVTLLDFDAACAMRFGQERGILLQHGIQIPTADLMIASTALVHNLTLATHNIADYQNIPGLRLVDWFVP